MSDELNEIMNAKVETVETVTEKKPQTEQEALSEMIITLAKKDYEEYSAGLKQKGYHLSRFMQAEMIVRAVEKGGKAKFNISPQACRCLTGLGFITENGVITFTLKPLDRATWQVSFKVDTSLMSNAQIYTYNEEYGLNIPLNKVEKELPEEEQYDCGFIRTKMLKVF